MRALRCLLTNFPRENRSRRREICFAPIIDGLFQLNCSDCDDSEPTCNAAVSAFELKRSGNPANGADP